MKDIYRVIKDSFAGERKLVLTTLRAVCNFKYVKLFVPICVFMFCLSCSKKIETEFDGQFLVGTKWKLSKFVDSKTSAFKVPEPKDCILFPEHIPNFVCYSLIFKTDSTLIAYTASNKLNGHYRVNDKRNGIFVYSLGTTHAGEFYDGEQFFFALACVKSSRLRKNELRLYYNDNKNYLLFKQIKK